MKICVCGHPHDVHAGGNVCVTMPCGCRGFRFDRVAEPSEQPAALTLPSTPRRSLTRRRFQAGRAPAGH